MCEQSSLPLWTAAHFGCQTSNNSIYNADKVQLRAVLVSCEFMPPAEIWRQGPSSERYYRNRMLGCPHHPLREASPLCIFPMLRSSLSLGLGLP